MLMKQTMIDVRAAVYRVLLSLIHILIIRTVTLVRHLTSCLAAFNSIAIENDLVSVRFDKLPRHLALVITDDLVSFPDVGQVVSWCMSLGIKNVTLYDHKGVIKCREEELRFCIDAALGKVQLGNLKAYILKPPNEKAKRNGSVFKSRDDVCQVNLLSCSDGKHDLVSTTRLLAESAVHSRGLETAELTVSNLEDNLHSNCGIPCPDLLISCGETFTSAGFLPWHIHLTEIFYLPTHHRISFNSVVQILKKFQLCQQRYGK